MFIASFLMDLMYVIELIYQKKYKDKLNMSL